MRNRSKLLLAGLSAALLLSLAIGSASANRLSINATRLRIVYTPLSFTAAGATVRCSNHRQGQRRPSRQHRRGDRQHLHRWCSYGANGDAPVAHPLHHVRWNATEHNERHP
jgi:hypothetical protein